MSFWLNNLRMAMRHKEVIILHGNVRDKYVDHQRDKVYSNLTELIKAICSEEPFDFSQHLCYDRLGERSLAMHGYREDGPRIAVPAIDAGRDAPPADMKQQHDLGQVLTLWLEALDNTDQSTLAVLFYLDKLAPYRERSGYSDEEQKTLVRLEKLVENITPNNRLVMVALQDSMVPVELYVRSPKTRLHLIPLPDAKDRLAYLQHSLRSEALASELPLIADLTDGLYLRDLDAIVRDLTRIEAPDKQQIRKTINEYRLGEPEDRWGQLDLEKMQSAFEWFTQESDDEDTKRARTGKIIKGQDDAVRQVLKVIRQARAGLSGMASGTPSKPRGVLFFAGPTGVGKTFLAKLLAEFLFGSEDAFIRIDMSELKEEQSVAKLIGSPPGYVGFDEGGRLTNAVKEKPFSVVLFDEVEKAHPRIMDIFLQILDEGRLTDSHGQTVFFTETVIIFTSNIGMRGRDERSGQDEAWGVRSIMADHSLAPEQRREKSRAHFTECVRAYFRTELSRPELLNRLGDNIVPFDFIDSRGIQEEIVASHFRRIEREFQDKFKPQGYRLDIRPAVVGWLIEKVDTHGPPIAEQGGRGVTNAIQSEILNVLAVSLLGAEMQKISRVTFQVDAERDKVIVRRVAA